jgi:ABC-type Fe3+-hydroxamate transport system substrate-binding protein
MALAFVDQLGQSIHLSGPPRRIISLVPSQTELLFDLGLDEQVVGITKFCVRPSSWSQKKTKVGGTKDFSFDRIEQLVPDLIIGNKEEMPVAFTLVAWR